MRALGGFFIAGMIRIMRSKTDFVLMLAWPVASVLFASLGFVRPEILPLVLMMTLGSQVAVSTGYDYGRIRETGVLRRLLASGVSPAALFVGINISRFAWYAASVALAITCSMLLGIRVNAAILALTLLSCGIVFTALGISVLRAVRSALGVLSAAPILILILSLPAFGSGGGGEKIYLYLSPVYAMNAFQAHPSLVSAAFLFLWIAVSIVIIGLFVYRRN